MGGLGAAVGSSHSAIQPSVTLLEQPHDASSSHCAHTLPPPPPIPSTWEPFLLHHVPATTHAWSYKTRDSIIDESSLS